MGATFSEGVNSGIKYLAYLARYEIGKERSLIPGQVER
jgi:hypothetical protein